MLQWTVADQSQEVDRASVRLGQTGRRSQASSRQRMIAGGFGIPAACGGLQPDLLAQLPQSGIQA